MPGRPLTYRQNEGRSCRTCGLELPRVHSTTVVELVTGPPGAGKTTLAMEQIQYGEAIVDLDFIWGALSAQPRHAKPEVLVQPMLAVRDEILTALSDFPVPRVWIVACAPTRNQRAQMVFPYDTARLTVLETESEVCKERLQDRPGSGWNALVDRWWHRYQPPAEGEGWARVDVV